MMSKEPKMKLPSMLAFERKLETSDALMYAGNWNDIDNSIKWTSIPITKRQNRSTQSACGIDDSKKTESNPVSSNSDDANLPQDKDTLKVSFTLRVIGNLGVPFSCNEPDFTSVICRKVDEFKKNNGLDTLAYRYACNIANGRFLWRNRVCAEDVRIDVKCKDLEPLVFNAYDFDLNDFEKESGNSGKQKENLNKLTEIIKTGLEGKDQFVFLEVNAYVKLGCGQHVFPSQEMNMREKQKVLFKLNNCAAMHNVKIGNAIRTIDDWYNDNAEFPIAIEPYGSVTQQGQAYRKKGNDLYTLMLSWVNENDDELETKKPTVNDKNYIAANFIRGGVFSGDKKQ